MLFADSQAKRRAQQIFNQVGLLIHEACQNSGVSDSFVAGFVGVEAAFENGKVVLDSRRFERGVYTDLISLRDKGYCFVGGKKHKTYSGVAQSRIADASDAAIRNLATSWGTTQIMGWHIINNLHCTIEDLRDPNKHFFFTIKLLKIVGGEYLRDGDLESVLHIWNTGNANGKTYHEDYVVNALLVQKHYEQILNAADDKFSKVSATEQQSRGIPAHFLAETETTTSGISPNPSDDSADVADALSPNQPDVQNTAQVKIESGESLPKPDEILPGTTPDDAPVDVSQSRFSSKVYAALGGIGGLTAAAKGFLSDNATLIIVGIVCVMILILALIFRGIILDWLRMQLFSDPKRYNVK